MQKQKRHILNAKNGSDLRESHQPTPLKPTTQNFSKTNQSNSFEHQLHHLSRLWSAKKVRTKTYIKYHNNTLENYQATTILVNCSEQ